MSNNIFDPVVQPDEAYFKKEFMYSFWPAKPRIMPEQYPDLTGKTAVVTGISAGIGAEVAKLLASKNCTVIGVVRNIPKAEAVVQRIYSELGDKHGKIELVMCDFGDLNTVKPAADRIALLTSTINYIIHNAATMPPRTDLRTVQGLELYFGTNNVGPQYLQNLIDPIFLNTPGEKRMVWVTSVGHFLGPLQGMYWENPSLRNTPNHSDWKVLYGHSKSINIYQAVRYGQLHPDVTSVAVYPGVLRTELLRGHGFMMALLNMFLYKPVYGAYSELYGIFGPVKSGDYIVPFGEVHQPRADIIEGMTNGNAAKACDILNKFITEFEKDPNTTDLYIK